MKRIVLDKPGLARLFCNIHPNMAAYIMAVDSPLRGLEREGRSPIRAPPGTPTPTTRGDRAASR